MLNGSVVFIGGMQRSGSTFTFNVARELLRARGSVFATSNGDTSAALADGAGSDNIIIKSHYPDLEMIDLIKNGRAKAIVSLRKPEDAIASWIETFGFTLEQSLRDFREWMIRTEVILPRSLTLEFVDVDRRPWSTISKIARYLDLRPTLVEQMRVRTRTSKARAMRLSSTLQKSAVNVVDVGFSHFDKATLLHRNHVSTLKSPVAAERIGHAAVATIRTAFKDRLDAEGNLRLDQAASALGVGMSAQSAWR